MRAVITATAGVFALILSCCGVACAHRPARSTVALTAPAPPQHDPDAGADYLARADQALDRLRERLSKKPRDAASPSAANERPTDTMPNGSQPIGTAWSVVVQQSRPSPAPSDTAARPGDASIAPRPPRQADTPFPGKKLIDVIGGLAAAVCGVLAIRRRAHAT